MIKYEDTTPPTDEQIQGNEYIGFQLGYFQSLDMGIKRINTNNRYQQSLVPNFELKTNQDTKIGTRLYKQEVKDKQIRIDFAFDSLTQNEFDQVKNWLGNNEVQPLSFYEDNQVIYVKLQGQPSINYICFDEEKDGIVQRIYKGEGNVNFIQYKFNKQSGGKTYVENDIILKYVDFSNSYYDATNEDLTELVTSQGEKNRYILSYKNDPTDNQKTQIKNKITLRYPITIKYNTRITYSSLQAPQSKTISFRTISTCLWKNDNNTIVSQNLNTIIFDKNAYPTSLFLKMNLTNIPAKKTFYTGVAVDFFNPSIFREALYLNEPHHIDEQYRWYCTNADSCCIIASKISTGSIVINFKDDGPGDYYYDVLQKVLITPKGRISQPQNSTFSFMSDNAFRDKCNEKFTKGLPTYLETLIAVEDEGNQQALRTQYINQLTNQNVNNPKRIYLFYCNQYSYNTVDMQVVTSLD